MLFPTSRAQSPLVLLANVVFLFILLASTLLWLHRSLPRAHAQPGASARPVQTPSPHFSPSRGRAVDTVVVHYISGINVDPDRWADPNLSLAILKRYRVSAHYLIDRAGTVYQLVQERHIAWHAGGSIMPAPDNRKNVNRFSIGIEVIATARSGYTDAQYRALADLIRGIKSRHRIRHLVGHDDIAGSRAVRMGLRRDLKVDPGPLFHWNRLRDLLGGE